MNYNKNKSIRASTDLELIPKGYEEHLVRTSKQNGDLFKQYGVSPEDKMAFFLLKWVWNSVKTRDTENNFFVSKEDLNSQLSSNKELLAALNKQAGTLKDDLQNFECKKGGQMDWTDFLDFFFYRGDPVLIQNSALPHWCFKIDSDGSKSVEDVAQVKDEKKAEGYSTFADFKEVPMTPALKILLDSRRAKTEAELEELYVKNNGKLPSKKQ